MSDVYDVAEAITNAMLLERGANLEWVREGFAESVMVKTGPARYDIRSDIGEELFDNWLREHDRGRMASAWREGFIAGVELNVMPNPYVEAK